jgi:hypothetical protein
MYVLCVHLWICVCMPSCVCVCLSVCLSVCQSVRLCLCLSVSLSLCPLCLSVSLSFGLYVCVVGVLVCNCVCVLVLVAGFSHALAHLPFRPSNPTTVPGPQCPHCQQHRRGLFAELASIVQPWRTSILQNKCV